MKLILKRRLLTCIIITSISSKFTYAQNYMNQFAITSDNDMYVNPNHDRYYSDATSVNFTHALNVDINNVVLEKKTFELDFGQQIYNPYKSYINLAGRSNSKLDRPFTGYLFAGGSINWLYKSERALKLTAQIGTIGPNALGRNVQVWFHNLLNLFPTRGWDQYQLSNEIGFNARLDYKNLLYRNSSEYFDIAFNPDIWLGNTFSGVSAAMQFRVGMLEKFYQSAITNSRVSNSTKKQGHEFYFFTVPQINYVAYNATIQGGLFINNKGPVTYDIYHWVYQQQFGLQFASARWSVNYVVYIKSKEVISTALGDQWGSVNIVYRFSKI